MRKGLLFVPLISLLFFGCASRDYVKQQMEPMVERMSKLEKDVREVKSLGSGSDENCK